MTRFREATAVLFRWRQDTRPDARILHGEASGFVMVLRVTSSRPSVLPTPGAVLLRGQVIASCPSVGASDGRCRPASSR
jgi:hypothetical protein